MLDRARARGEEPLYMPDVLDVVLTPTYARVLFGVGPLTPDCIDDLVDRVLVTRAEGWSRPPNFRCDAQEGPRWRIEHGPWGHE